MIKKLLLASTIFLASPVIAGPWLVGQQTPTYTDAHPLGSPNTAPFYTAGEPADISGGFTTSTWLHTGNPPMPNGTTSEFSGIGSGGVESKARFDCNVAFESHDDPIIAPGVPNGASHDHTFFGNTAAAAAPYNATYASLRAAGNSTCYGGPLNRTLYWEPSVKKVLSSGVVATIKPKNIVTYYESGALADIGTGRITDPLVGTRWPRSLDMIAGFDMNDPTNSRVTSIIAALNALPGRSGQYSALANNVGGGFVGWQCFTYNSGSGAKAYLSADGGVTANIDCAPNTDIFVEMFSYPCWDGKNPTSPNGRLHMMPLIRDNFNSKNVCPDNWYRVMQFRAKVIFKQTGPSDYKTWFFSSDRMPGMNASTFTGSISGTTLTVSGVTGLLAANHTITGTGIPANTVIVSGSGSTWTINTSLTISSEAMASPFNYGETGHFDLIPAWDYGTAANPGTFLKFSNHCDGQTIVTPDSGTVMTGDGNECGYGRISLTENVYVNEASPDSSSPNPVVNLNPDQTGTLRYFPLVNGTSVPGPVNNHH
jgi:hypothetical protein